jgi:hypothetical protein
LDTGHVLHEGAADPKYDKALPTRKVLSAALPAGFAREFLIAPGLRGSR